MNVSIGKLGKASKPLSTVGGLGSGNPNSIHPTQETADPRPANSNQGARVPLGGSKLICGPLAATLAAALIACRSDWHRGRKRGAGMQPIPSETNGIQVTTSLNPIFNGGIYIPLLPGPSACCSYHRQATLKSYARKGKCREPQKGNKRSQSPAMGA